MVSKPTIAHNKTIIIIIIIKTSLKIKKTNKYTTMR
jgi:hypothetical protein